MNRTLNQATIEKLAEHLENAELQAYVLDANDEVTDTIVARVAYNNHRS